MYRICTYRKGQDMTEKAIKPKRMTREQIRKGLDSVPMDTILLGVNSGARLTHKQKEFARMVALGESKAQSYRKAYNSKGKATTAAREGHQLSRNPNIAAMTEAFAQAKAFTESHTPEQLRAFVIQQLTAHAANEENPPTVRLAALKTLGTVAEVSAFVHRTESVVIKKSGDLRERIAAKLELIGASSTFDNDIAQDNSIDADSLLIELQPPTPDENAPDDTHATQPPPELGVELSDDTHTIPHNQISEESVPHTRILSEPHNQSSAEPVWSDESDDSIDDGSFVSLHTVEEPTQDDPRASHFENSK